MSDAKPRSAAVDQVWRWLEDVPDPEVPAVSVVDLGIVRDVVWSGHAADECVVTVTPTYSGCPATEVIADDIRQALQARGVPQVRLHLQLSPAWTTDWLSPEAHEKLRRYGIAPPVGRAAANEQVIDISRLRSQPLMPARVACPRCGSTQTELTSQFGSTACKALYRCLSCREPFDYFKCH